VFDELLVLQLGLQWRRQRLEEGMVGLDNRPDDGRSGARLVAACRSRRRSRRRARSRSIAEDLARERPMHRLLQGDVGSGKTLVALWTMLAAVDRGRQAALMAPTELLAEQHLRTLTALLAPLGVNVPGRRARRAADLLDDRGAAPPHPRRPRGRRGRSRRRHACAHRGGCALRALGVVVIDEQHRFGVSQRVALKDKTGDGSGDGTCCPTCS
jgi:ATP-dependent DNA helicase RecG